MIAHSLAIPILALVLGVNSLAQRPASPQGPEAHLDLARRFLSARDLEKASQQAAIALQLSPGMVEAEDLLGVVEALSGRLENAERHFTRALEIRPDFVPAHFNLARVYLNRGKSQMAARELQTVTHLDPWNAGAHYYLGILLQKSNRNQEALSHFEKARMVEPKDVDLLIRLLESQLDLKRPDAEKTLQAIEGLLGDRDPRFLQLGGLLASRGAYALAIATFQKLLSVDPDSYDASYNLALAYFLSKDNNKAETVLNRLLRQHNVAEAHNLLARVHEDSGEYLKALGQYEQAAVMEPTNEDYRFDFCFLLVKHRALKFALSQLTRATEDFPKSARLRIILGAAQFLKPNFDLALQELLQAIEADPSISQSYYYLGKIYEKVGQESQKKIMQKLRDYLALNPKDPWANYSYGVGLFQEQQRLGDAPDFSEAQTYLLKAIALKSDLAPAYFSLGLLYYAQSRTAESIEQFQQASKASPQMHEAHYRLAIAYSKLGMKQESERELHLHQKLRSESADDLDKRRKEFFDIIPTMKSLSSQRH